MNSIFTAFVSQPLPHYFSSDLQESQDPCSKSQASWGNLSRLPHLPLSPPMVMLMHTPKSHIIYHQATTANLTENIINTWSRKPWHLTCACISLHWRKVQICIKAWVTSMNCQACRKSCRNRPIRSIYVTRTIYTVNAEYSITWTLTLTPTCTYIT